MDQSTSVKRRCDEEAARMVQENNVGLYVMTSMLYIHIYIYIYIYIYIHA